MDPIQLLENFRKHAIEVVESLLTLIYGSLWEREYRSAKYGNLVFTIVPHGYGAFAHHLEVGPFPYNFILSSVPGPFLRDDEKIGRSREVVEVLKKIL